MQLHNISNQDINLTVDQLQAKYSPAGGGQHPTFTREDWITAIGADATISGYWQWVHGEIQSLLDDTLVSISASTSMPAAVSVPEGVPGVRQLQFIAVISGTVDVNDGERGSPRVTESQLGAQLSHAIDTMIGNGGITGDTPAVVDNKHVSIQVAERLQTTHQTVGMLRDKGFAVAIFNPDELGEVAPRTLQNKLVEFGVQEIDNLQR
ncbi:hypothetical protein ACQCLI_31980 (plasmid) [Pseudomonas nitroreducens]|uniref:hypothetical protein n=1 Tax=Pseudomonas nitroreducens TaxID=46680 RepID=UPI000305EFEE|nr:hypothetical protein [Pseudomonas nitroreducens]